MVRRALITGISGQDGSYLAELLLARGYEVHGIVRRVALEEPQRRLSRIIHFLDKVTLHPASLESYPSLFQIISRHRFDECYHLAAQSFVAETLDSGFDTMSANINGTHYLLSALYQLNAECKFYFAGTSEMFGVPKEVPQSETTPFHPRNPYGISKVAGFHLTVNFREVHGMFCCCGILYNHEGPRRGFEYVTRKVTSHAAKIRLGMSEELRLGSLESRRDWGHAADCVAAMYLMMQQAKADDYVIASGELHSVREVCDIAFSELGLDYRNYVIEDPRFMRPPEAVPLVGDATKARRTLGWCPRYKFEDTIREMVHADLRALQMPHSL